MQGLLSCHSGLDPESFSPYLHTMAGVYNKETRSYNMSQIKATKTKPELLVRKFLHANGFRYTLHDKKLPGKPDIVLPKYKTNHKRAVTILKKTAALYPQLPF